MKELPRRPLPQTNQAPQGSLSSPGSEDFVGLVDIEGEVVLAGYHLHDKEGEELVLLVHLSGGHRVTVVVVSVHYLSWEASYTVRYPFTRFLNLDNRKNKDVPKILMLHNSDVINYELFTMPP